MNGVWQALNTANWDLQDHAAAPGPFYQLGAIGAVPPGQASSKATTFRICRPRSRRRKKNYVNR